MTEERDIERERLVRVAVAENAATAQIIRETLATAGIRSLLRNRDNASAYLGSLAAPFALEVYVLEGDAGAASALLDATSVPPPRALPQAKAKPRKRRRRR